MNNLISVIIPCYNAKKYILETLHTVQAEDKYIGEIIVIDDASPDGSADYVQSLNFPKLTLHRLDHNQGPSAARNYGIVRAQYPYVAFLDADDLWTDGRTEALMNALNTKDTPWAFGQISHFLSDDYSGAAKFALPATQIGYFAGCMLVKTDFLNSVGLFNESLKLGEFIDWYHRARTLAPPPPALWDHVTLKRRLHGTNTSILTDNNNAKDYLKAARDAIKRKKNSNSGN